MNTATLKWWHFSQNNSGGYFLVNDMVAEDVFIQAPTAEQARARAEVIFADNSAFCDCCGARWYDDARYENDGYDVPSRWGQTLGEVVADRFNTEARLHHFDGLVESYTYHNNHTNPVGHLTYQPRSTT
tara:strand:+ start:173 stop:559 length:387 start_codon:yes stop_codon:yes gene_type:complete